MIGGASLGPRMTTSARIRVAACEEHAMPWPHDPSSPPWYSDGSLRTLFSPEGRAEAEMSTLERMKKANSTSAGSRSGRP